MHQRTSGDIPTPQVHRCYENNGVAWDTAIILFEKRYQAKG